MSDTKWTTLAALSHAASAVVSSLIELKRKPGHPDIHERVALLEERLRVLSEKVEDGE